MTTSSRSISSPQGDRDRGHPCLPNSNAVMLLYCFAPLFAPPILLPTDQPPFHFVAHAYPARSYPSLVCLACINPPTATTAGTTSPTSHPLRTWQQLSLCTPLNAHANYLTLTHHEGGRWRRKKAKGSASSRGARRPGARGTHHGGPQVSDDWFSGRKGERGAEGAAASRESTLGVWCVCVGCFGRGTK